MRMPAKSAPRIPAPPSVLDACPPENAFRFANGHTARHLPDLRDRVALMDAGTVEHHRHHYQHWVREILRDPAFADELATLGLRGELAGERYRAALRAALDARLRTAAGGVNGKKSKARGATTRSPRASGSRKR